MDAVICWVDGSDPVHIEKRQRYRAYKEWHTRAIEETRFDSSGEVYFCIASILKYAPVFSKIWLVTDGQRPKLIDEFSRWGLCAEDFIEIVDHKIIFSGFEEVLPTFNSISIASVIHRIPKLSEYFVYFNDDVFINQKLDRRSFFSEGLPVIRGKKTDLDRSRTPTGRARALWNSLIGMPITHSKPSFRQAQQKAALISGAKRHYFQIDHTPHPLRRSVIQKFYKSHPEILASQLTYRFRSEKQYSSVSLAYHLEILNNHVQPITDFSLAYIKPEKIKNTTISDIMQGRSKFGCVQSLDQIDPIASVKIKCTLKKKFETHLPESILQEI